MNQTPLPFPLYFDFRLFFAGYKRASHRRDPSKPTKATTSTTSDYYKSFQI
uniref:Uncharacterized protein n=1 Tax=Solanum tuberosum TaxID=4113 RepID=M1D706_SOLTU